MFEGVHLNLLIASIEESLQDVGEVNPKSMPLC